MSWIMQAHVVIRLQERYHKYSLWSLKPFAEATLTHLATSTLQTGTNICGKQFKAMETKPHLPERAAALSPGAGTAKDQGSPAQCDTDTSPCHGHRGTAQALLAQAGAPACWALLHRTSCTGAGDKGRKCTEGAHRDFSGFWTKLLIPFPAWQSSGEQSSILHPSFQNRRRARGAAGALLNASPQL